MGCMQRIRRFLSNVGISPTITVLPLIRLMRPLLSNLPEIVLAMDRTDWEKCKKYINILTVAICYKGRAIPVYWKVFDRKGNSSFKDWKEVLTPVIKGLQQMEWLSGIMDRQERSIDATASRAGHYQSMLLLTGNLQARNWLNGSKAPAG